MERSESSIFGFKTEDCYMQFEQRKQALIKDNNLIRFYSKTLLIWEKNMAVIFCWDYRAVDERTIKLEGL